MKIDEAVIDVARSAYKKRLHDGVEARIREDPLQEAIRAAIEAAFAAMPEHDGETAAWQVRVKWIRPRKGENEWSHWQFVDKEQHDAVLRGEGFFQYKNAEARALIVASAPAAVDGKTQEYTLRAMAMNYSGGHSWDHLDSDACRNGANEIASLRALLATANSAEGKVVPDAKTADDYERHEHFDNEPDAYCTGHMDGWNACRGAMLNAHKASAKGEG